LPYKRSEVKSAAPKMARFPGAGSREPAGFSDDILGDKGLQGQLGQKSADALHLDEMMSDSNEYWSTTSAKVTLRSGARHHFQMFDANVMRRHGSRSTGRMSMALNRKTQQKIVNARGASSLLLP